MKNKFYKYFQPVDDRPSMSKGLSNLDLSEDLGTIGNLRREKYFLKRFTREDLYKIIESVGLLDHLDKRLGIDTFDVEIDVDETLINYCRLYAGKPKPENLLLDLRLSETRFIPDPVFFGKEKDASITYDMIVIEWLSAQNPQNNFSKIRPQLPGQKSPGLGILRFCFEMMYIVGKEVIKDGFLDIPDHMHGAIMYSKKFKFFNPAHEGILRAIIRDLSDYSLADISWGMITETIIEKYKQKPQVYDPSEQIFPVSRRMNNYYNSRKYKSTFNKYYRRKRYKFNYDEMVAKREEILKNKKITDL